MDGHLFDFDDVVVDKAGRRALDGLTGYIPDHLVTVIAGPSGSGKTTLLRLCNHLDTATTGTVRFTGRAIDQVDPLRLRREVGMVFQRPTPLPGTVADNLRVARPTATDDEIDLGLVRVGLDGFATRSADELSGGEAQRMGLARTLLTNPRFVLFDEPTSALDPSATNDIEALVAQLAIDGIPSAWVTHDMGQLRRLAHHAVFVIDGVIAQQGHLDDVLSAPSPAIERFISGDAQ
ncbi:ATP-binding cassette domain-containing protein [Iamia sp.]|uniref:ATP-binding cassette domain-containing protein n=1 Tax=Iamia sp. TaxID=2722710 RepID=UPI002BD8CA95|nr:ATP-binding cassette domain-containing protein [Iamia sp.]HXH59523.1 ATP-binding cassette domain-containing protein [Iamia sp.]